MQYVIETENLIKQYGNTKVVNGINLHVPKGTIYGLLGRNGAGKTTAMKMMLNLVQPTKGNIYLFGEHSKENIYKAYSKIGSIIETPGFYTNLTGYENLKIIAKLRGNLPNEMIIKALKAVNLENENGKIFSDYSLGMKQRLGIVAAIMHDPELLILDEPINGLDPIGISLVRSFLLSLRNQGTTILISSHVLSEIEQIADVIGVMNKGTLIEEADIVELRKRKRKYCEFIVSDTNKVKNILNKHLKITDFTIQENTIRIYDFKTPVEEINKTFVKNNVAVTGIRTEEENLEEYFSNLIGGGQIA